MSVPVILVDADACPVKDEVYRVAKRYAMKVVVVANNPLRVPATPLVELVVKEGFGGVDDWIAEQVGPGDLAVTADVPFAARCVAKGCLVLDTKGHPLTPDSIGSAVAMRDLREELRQGGELVGGSAPMTPKDRSRFLAKLDEMVNAVRRAYPPNK